MPNNAADNTPSNDSSDTAAGAPTHPECWDDVVLLEGPLHGHIVPSESMWAVDLHRKMRVSSNGGSGGSGGSGGDSSDGVGEAEGAQSDGDDDSDGGMVHLSLEKAHSSREIWATLLNRDYLLQQQRQTQLHAKKSEGSADDMWGVSGHILQ